MSLELDQIDHLNSLINNRHYYYDQLFDCPLDNQFEFNENDISVASLCRLTRKEGKRSRQLDDHLNLLPKLITNILSNNDARARNNQEAVFGFIDQTAFENVTKITAHVFYLWELSQSRNHLSYLVDEQNESNDLNNFVIETASAVMSLGSEKQYFDFNQPADQKKIAKLLANWSPNFINEWFEGKTIQQWYQDSGISQEKQQEWNKIFTPSMVKNLIVHNSTDPIGTLNTIKYNLETVLTDQNIADQLDWPLEEVKSFLTTGLKIRFAMHNILDPLKAVRRFKYNLETVLTDQNIADQLDWPVDKIKTLLTSAEIKGFAIRNSLDPLKAVRRFKYNLETVLTDQNIADQLDWPLEEVESTFTFFDKKHVALNSGLDPLEALKKIKYNLETVLTDQNIADQLNWSSEEISRYLPWFTKKYVAIGYIDNPLEALKKIKYNLETVLTDQNIADQLDLSLDKVQTLFTPYLRKYVAVHHIMDPLASCQRYYQTKTLDREY